MSRLSKNIMYNLTGKIALFAFGILLGLLSVKYMFKQLGEEALGIIYFVSTIDDVLLSSLRKGVSSTAVREVAAYIDSDTGYVRDFVQTWSSICWVAFLLLGVVAYFLAPLIVEKWLVIKVMDAGTAIYVLRVLSIAGLLALPKSLYTSLIVGVQRMEFTNLIAVAIAIVQRLGTILIIIQGAHLYIVVYWIAFCYFLETAACFIVSSRLLPLGSFVPRFSIKVLLKNIKFGMSMVYISVFSILQTQSDRLALSKLLPIGALGYYVVTFNNISRCNLLTTSISQAAFPSLCEKFGSEGRDGMVNQYKKLQDFVCFMTIPVFAAIPFAALPGLTFVFNGDVAKSLMIPVVLLSLAFYMNSTLSMPYQLSLAAGRPDIAVKQGLYSLLLALPVTIVFIYYFKLKGAGLGWVLYHSVGYIYSIPRICRECMHKPSWFFFRNLSLIGFFTGITYGTAWLILYIMEGETIATVCIAYLVSTCLYLIAAFYTIDQALKKSIIGYIFSLRNDLFRSFFKLGVKGVNL